MKIAFIVSEFPSLSQTFVLNQITGLLDRGHEVDIFAKKADIASIVHEEVTKYNLLERTLYFTKMPQNKLYRFIKSITLILKYLPHSPFQILKSLNFIKHGKEAVTLNLLYQTIPFINKGPYDVIQCHFGSFGNIAVLLREAGIISGKIVTTFHGYDLTSYIRKKNIRIYEKLFESGDLFLPISNRWKKKLIQLGCKKDKIIVHRMGVDSTKISYSKHIRKEGQPIRILSVGRLVEKKGINFGIQAVAKTINRISNIEYLIAGDGPLREDLTKQINMLNLGHKIKLLGYMRQEKIFKLMSRADIFLAPSVTSKSGDQEGIPVVLMEAMAHGLPIISTYHSGIPELIINGCTGFLVKEGDINEIAEKIEFLICNPKIARKISLEGRKNIEKEYAINRLNDNLIAIYQNI
jgi:colanic acid/amylovoran biosynthesis glycosyltransferase